MKKITYTIEEDNVRELESILQHLTEMHDRLENVLDVCKVWINNMEIKDE